MNNTTTQVGPLTGIDFSKIRKFSKGSKIPKYQTAFQPIQRVEDIPQWFKDLYKQQNLTNWNSHLDSSKWTTSGNTHGQAGDLLAAYNQMQEYSGNREAVQGDIQSYYNTLKGAGTLSAEDFVTKYNKGIAQLNDFWKDGTTHSYGDTGVGNFNNTFNQMYSSRSSETGDIPAQDNLNDIMGSQTWLRRPDRYETEFDALDEEGKRARTFTVNIDGQNVQVYKKADGTIQLLSATANNASADQGTAVTNQTATDQTAGAVSQNANTDNSDSTDTNKKESTNPATFQNEKDGKFQYKPTAWTDPIHLAAIRGQNERAINRHYDALNDFRTPLVQPDQRTTTSTSNYAERQARLKQANALLANTARNATADATTNNMMMQQAYANYQNITDGNTQLMQQAAEESNKRQDEVNAYNGYQNTWAANENMKQLRASEKTRATNNASRIAGLNYNDTDYINKVDASHNQWVAHNRDLMNSKITAHNQQQYEQYLEPKYQAIMDIERAGVDPYAQQLATEYMDNAGNFTLSDDEAQALSDIQDNASEDQKVAAIQEYIKNNPDSTLGKLAQKRYQEAHDKAYTDYTDSARRGQLYLNELLSLQDTQFSGEGFLNTKIDNSLLWGDGPAIKMAKGGRFLDYLEHNRKVRKDLNDRVDKESSRQVRLLQTKLNALNRETIMLLRSIFS